MHLEHLKYKTYKCYKCNKRGHVAAVCDTVCKKCGVPHKERFCIGEITQFIMEMNYLQCSVLKEFRKSSATMSSVEVVKNMEKYLKKAYAKIEGYRHVVNGIFSVNRKEKQTQDIFEDFINLYKLRKIEEIQKSHAEITREYQKKINEIKEEVDKMAQDRKEVLRQENIKFLEAKAKGLPALVNYKLSRANQRQKEKWMKMKIKLDYISEMRELEESEAVKYWTTLESRPKESTSPAPKHRYMFFSSQSTQKTKIIASGNNVNYAKAEVKKIDGFINKLNRGLATLKSKKPLSSQFVADLYETGIKMDHKIYIQTDRLDLMTALPLYLERLDDKVKYMNELLESARSSRRLWEDAARKNRNILFSS